MPIIINHNLCDEAPECGGIEVCPVGAFYYDYKRKKVAVDKKKCIECLKCTLPDACPVGCIIYARNEKEEKKIKKAINNNTKTRKWLWKERFGCQPALTPPKAKIVTNSNLDSILKLNGFKLIDVWHNDFLDCRYHSVLFEDVVGNIKVKITAYKLDGQNNNEVVKKLKIKKFPTLLIYKDNKEIWRFEEYISKNNLKEIKDKLKKLI